MKYKDRTKNKFITFFNNLIMINKNNSVFLLPNNLIFNKNESKKYITTAVFLWLWNDA